jgi:hypothetical protein
MSFFGVKDKFIFDTVTTKYETMEPCEKQEIIEAINNSHQIAFQSFNKLVENTVKAFSDQMGQFEERNRDQHKEIIKRQDHTNGNVSVLQKETAIFRWCLRNPKLAAILLLLLVSGAITLGVILGIDNLIGIVP